MSILRSSSRPGRELSETVCGPGGETYYVWPAFPTDGSDIKTPLVKSPDTRTTRRPERVEPVRYVRRRVTANRKERRRTLSLNNAFSELRGCIPYVPPDTKLSKKKILRLATSYIAYLTEVLAEDESFKSTAEFRAEITKSSDISSGKKREPETPSHLIDSTKSRKANGRTGWPQDMWALELKHENPT
ncbi:heart- and neural crest derivatives-expressed protein 2-like [Stegodyphus dumicola]|uniref:heart- and neural crest derivatives-expressed protein 2-like n=1 Tax=Stegodyphus dumicola TaxID=202533 RepID=UPI0015AD4E49|nr:heart- and neural crest derivatives-expressed protein 2-like [Stegodyphus dumicola]